MEKLHITCTGGDYDILIAPGSFEAAPELPGQKLLVCDSNVAALYREKAERLLKPVDTVGAGDSNLGAIIACRVQGLSWPSALAHANRVSGAVCQVAGAVMDDADFIRFGLGL